MGMSCVCVSRFDIIESIRIVLDCVCINLKKEQFPRKGTFLIWVAICDDAKWSMKKCQTFEFDADNKEQNNESIDD